VPLTTLAVSWVLANPVITAPIIGASQPGQLADSLRAAEYVLDPGLKEQLDKLTLGYRKGDAVR
jgi:aryl-alcohol dehydrogenase (NADP+)